MEAITTLAVISAILGGLVMTSDSLRAGSAFQRTQAILRPLRAALNRYTTDHGSPPRGPTVFAITTLLADRATAPLLHDLPLSFDSFNRPTILDGYGNAIAYQPANTQTSTNADFVSPGPDGKLGSPTDTSAKTDDIFGADTEGPMP